MNPRHLLRAVFPVLLLVIGVGLVFPGSAGARPWRSVQAPPETIALVDFLMQPHPRGTPGGDEGDTTGNIEKPIDTGSPVVNPTPSKQPGGGSVPDTARTSFFNRAQEESLRMALPGMRSNTQDTAPPPPGARRGVLGIHPLAILVGLIALDIFVVTVAGK